MNDKLAIASDVYYEYLDGDVWYKITEENVEIVYTKDILAELFGEDNSEPESDNGN